MSYTMKYVPKITSNAVIAGYCGKNSSVPGKVAGYLAVRKTGAC